MKHLLYSIMSLRHQEDNMLYGVFFVLTGTKENAGFYAFLIYDKFCWGQCYSLQYLIHETLIFDKSERKVPVLPVFFMEKPVFTNKLHLI